MLFRKHVTDKSLINWRVLPLHAYFRYTLVSAVLLPERKHPLLINLKFSKNSGIIVYHCRTVCKNFKIFNETGKDFVLIQ
jgi:hypothetical protein